MRDYLQSEDYKLVSIMEKLRATIDRNVCCSAINSQVREAVKSTPRRSNAFSRINGNEQPIESR